MFVIWDLYTYYCMKIFVINKNVYITYNVTNPAAILTSQHWTTSNLKIEMTLTFGWISFESWMDVEISTLLQRWTTDIISTLKSSSLSRQG